jgi:hypothetical protein
MDKTIVTALLITISMIMALMLFNVAYPAILEGGDSISQMANRTSERMGEQLTVIHATAEADDWQITNSTDFEVFAWIKNTGDARIKSLEHLDVFFGLEGQFYRIPYSADGATGYPYWQAAVEDGLGRWDPHATLRLTIYYSGKPVSGRYFLKVSAPSGVSDDYFLSIS